MYATHADGLKGMVALGARIRSQCAVKSRELAIGLATRQGGVAATRVAELEDKVLDMQRLVAAVELNKELRKNRQPRLWLKKSTPMLLKSI